MVLTYPIKQGTNTVLATTAALSERKGKTCRGSGSHFEPRWIQCLGTTSQRPCRSLH